MYDFMEEHPTVGVSGPQMLGTDNRVGRSYMRFPTVWNCLCNAICLSKVFKTPVFGGTLMTDFDNAKTAEVDVLNGWFLVIRRKALESVGGFDEQFFMYGEDMDWSYRFHKGGWPRVYFAGTAALHYGGSSSARAPIRFYIEMYKANFQYWRKHHTRAGVVGYWLTLLLHQSIRLAAYMLAYLLKVRTNSEAAFKGKRSAACIAWLIGLRSIVRWADNAQYRLRHEGIRPGFGRLQ
jgi:GT2 family glycosyltransferase